MRVCVCVCVCVRVVVCGCVFVLGKGGVVGRVCSGCGGRAARYYTVAFTRRAAATGVALGRHRCIACVCVCVCVCARVCACVCVCVRVRWGNDVRVTPADGSVCAARAC